MIDDGFDDDDDYYYYNYNNNNNNEVLSWMFSNGKIKLFGFLTVFWDVISCHSVTVYHKSKKIVIPCNLPSDIKIKM